ncbi:MAG: AAA family ATPase [Acidobacteria bacterium]|nr:AAA family ATPase [Acidobacteriota bacterium]
MTVACVSGSDEDASVFLRRIALQNLLSFGSDETALELQPLNVLIGPNGSGKSNLIAAIGLLQAAAKDLTAPIRATGGIGEWLHKGERRTRGGTINTVVGRSSRHGALRYRLSVEAHGHRFRVGIESVEDNESEDGRSGGRAHYTYSDGTGTLVPRDGVTRLLDVEELDPEQSILSQLKDPHASPEITDLGKQFDGIRIYREWSFGQGAPTRSPQPSDLRNDFLAEDTSNLGLVLNRLRRTPAVKKRLLEAARKLYDGLTDFDVIVEGGTVQVFLEENGITVPAVRLSDGTLRYLCLLAILCHDDPPPLVCIEEPELGLHPDMMPTLADLLREASARCQLIVTTHSDVLVDELAENPESVVVCEKHEGRTGLQRLNRKDLSQWLARYSVGELWRKGELGGNRW